MKRRGFIGFAGWIAANWPIALLAQQDDRKKRVGILISRPENDTEGRSYLLAFQQALEPLGWRAGQNIEIESRWTAGDARLADTFAAELVALKPDVLVINSTGSVIATRRVAGSLPIVMAAVADPVAQGFVQSLERPGGNVTGFA